MERLELPGESWAELRDPSEVTERGRRPVANSMIRVSAETFTKLQSIDPEEMAKAIASESSEQDLQLETQEIIRSIPAAEMEALEASNDYCIVALVKKWSYEQEITLDGVLDLPAEAYDILRATSAPAVRTLFVKFAASKDAASPTVPSSASNGHSGAAASIIETPSPPSGEPIASSALD